MDRGQFGFMGFARPDRQVGPAAREVDVVDAGQDFESNFGKLFASDGGQGCEHLDGESGGRCDPNGSGWALFRALGEAPELTRPTRHLLGGRKQAGAVLGQLGATFSAGEELAAESALERGDSS